MKYGEKSRDIEDLMGNLHFHPNYHTQDDYDKDIAQKIILSLDWKIKNMVNDLKKEQVYKENPRMILDNLKKKFSSMLTTMYRKHRCQFKKTTLLREYKSMILRDDIKDNRYLNILLMKSPSRDISGINQITLLTSPRPLGRDFSCKHDCFYCPNEPAHEGNGYMPQPRSYLFQEPAVLRANNNKFDPFLQTTDRLRSLLMCGHKCDKLEFILEGGTFTEYPKAYLVDYFRDFIYACNVFYEVVKIKDEKIINAHPRPRLSLQEEITINKNARCKIIGICIETRPDSILENDEDGIPWVKTLLNWGVTRLQLGMQHIDNRILKKINRGHTVEQVEKAIRICKDNCFKIDIHIMPDLPLSSPEKDIQMFDEIYTSEKYQPDQMKIYPCETVPWTKIKKWYDEGSYVPYGSDKLVIQNVLNYAMEKCPPWIRLPRVVRDIPHDYISGGLKCGNMRQNIEQETEFNGRDIRVREIGRHPQYTIKDAHNFIQMYKASHGTEYFISIESYDKKALFGFCRLRIPSTTSINDKDIMFPSTLKDCGLIRELHVYGSLVGVLLNESNDNSVQHSGIGKRLLQIAEHIALFKHGKKGMVVISGIGVRGYYEKRGYQLENNYMVKSFYTAYHFKMIMLDIIFVFVLLYYLFVSK